MRTRRREVDPETREEYSVAICEAVWLRTDVQEAVAARRPFAVYLANDEEIDLMPLVERLWAEGVTVAVPYWHVEARTYRLAIYTNATTLIETSGPWDYSVVEQISEIEGVYRTRMVAPAS